MTGCGWNDRSPCGALAKWARHLDCFPTSRTTERSRNRSLATWWCCTPTGVSEATNQDGEELGRDGLMALARRLDSRPAEAFGTQFVKAVREFRGGTVPQDDETIIVMQRVSATE